MRRIKIILVFFLVIMTTGCSIDDDDNTNFFFEAVAIEQVSIPDRFIRGQTFEISVSYFRPTNCHSFSGFNYDRLGNERTVTVINVVVDNGTICEDLEKIDLIEESFDFFVGGEDSYIFRFWQGRNDQGNNQFLTVEVPVDI